MKTRIIQTRFWDDEYISECSLEAAHLYIYVLTSSHINISGIFQLPEKKAILESKLSAKQFKDAIEELYMSKKVIFYCGWVYVKNAQKNNNYIKSPQNKIAHEREMSQIPTSILSFFEKERDSSMDSTIHTDGIVPINNKSETINKKEGGVGGTKFDMAWLKNIDAETVTDLALKFETTEDYVKLKSEKILDYCASKGKTYTDYKATLRNWIRDDDKRPGKYAQTKSNITVITDY